MASANYAQISLSEVYLVASFPYKKVKKISPRRSTGVLVCWLVRWFVRDARCELVIPRKKKQKTNFHEIWYRCSASLPNFTSNFSEIKVNVQLQGQNRFKTLPVNRIGISYVRNLRIMIFNNFAHH